MYAKSNGLYVKNKAYFVKGKFYPEGMGSERAKDFYIKNGYSIEYDDYWHGQAIFKNLLMDKQNTQNFEL